MGYVSSGGQAASGGGGPKVRQHDTTHSPLGLWQLDGDMTDASGNGYDLTVDTGTELYAPISDTLQGFRFDGSTNLIHDVAEAALRLTGDMTIEMLVAWLIDPPGFGVNTSLSGPYLAAHGVPGEAGGDNNLYSLKARPTGGIGWLSESGSGTNAVYDIDCDVPTYLLHHLAAVRASNVVSMYIDGGLVGSSSTLATPTGGNTGRFVLGSIGGGGGEHPTCLMASVKLIGSALTAEQVADEYRLTLG